MFITGVKDTGDKLFSGVNGTSGKIIAGFNPHRRLILVTDFS
jgi:hypothetical protein